MSLASPTGGPGSGSGVAARCFFDPSYYRIVVFDQRGAARSSPPGCLEANNSLQLAKDIQRLRKHLVRWQIGMGMGGRGGAVARLTPLSLLLQTRALMFGTCCLEAPGVHSWPWHTPAMSQHESHPWCCEASSWVLLLRSDGCTKMEGHQSSSQMRGSGTAWSDASVCPSPLTASVLPWCARYVSVVPPGERGDMLEAYYARLTSQDSAVREQAAAAFIGWETAICRVHASAE